MLMHTSMFSYIIRAGKMLFKLTKSTDLIQSDFFGFYGLIRFIIKKSKNIGSISILEVVLTEPISICVFF